MPAYDAGERRKGVREGKFRGVWVYVPAEELEKAGFSRDEPPPRYRIWGRGRGSVLVRLYRD